MKMLVVILIASLSGCGTYTGANTVMVDGLNCQAGKEVMYCDNKGGHADCWCAARGW